MLNRFFFGLKHLAPRVAHNPQIMSGNTLISLRFSLTGDEGDGDDEDDSAQAESTRLQLTNKRRSVFTPSSRKKTVCCLQCLRGWGRGEGGSANSQSPADCKWRGCTNADSTPHGRFGWFRHQRHHLRPPESPRYFLPLHLQAWITPKASNMAKKKPPPPPSTDCVQSSRRCNFGHRYWGKVSTTMRPWRLSELRRLSESQVSWLW